MLSISWTVTILRVRMKEGGYLPGESILKFDI